MSFSTLIDREAASLNEDQLATIKTAFTTFQTSLDAELVTYGLKSAERIWVQEKIVEMVRSLAAQMRTSTATVSGAILTEAGVVLVQETDETPILLEV